jgi:hypothetical protein
MLAGALTLGLTGAGAMLFAPKPSPALSCVDIAYWTKSAWLETLRVDGEEVELPARSQEAMIEANSFEHLPRLHRERLDKWDHCYWNFEPLATETDAEVKP